MARELTPVFWAAIVDHALLFFIIRNPPFCVSDFSDFFFYDNSVGDGNFGFYLIIMVGFRSDLVNLDISVLECLSVLKL
jgi:hypothetical protein